MRTEIILTSLFNTPALKEVQGKGGIIYTAMVSPFKGRTEPNQPLLAATKELVFGHKRGTGDLRWKQFPIVTDDEYRIEYLKILNTRRNAIDKWLSDCESHMALCCSCKGGLWGAKETGRWNFCHLDILDEWFFITYGKNYTVKRL